MAVSLIHMAFLFLILDPHANAQEKKSSDRKNYIEVKSVEIRLRSDENGDLLKENKHMSIEKGYFLVSTRDRTGENEKELYKADLILHSEHGDTSFPIVIEPWRLTVGGFLVAWTSDKIMEISNFDDCTISQLLGGYSGTRVGLAAVAGTSRLSAKNSEGVKLTTWDLRFGFKLDIMTLDGIHLEIDPEYKNDDLLELIRNLKLRKVE